MKERRPQQQPGRQQQQQHMKVRSLNKHITCQLCHGYFINATTIIECLHTFCKSCLVRYLDEHNTCPVCDTLIHHSHPKQYISFDRTLQDIVYKLVPGLHAKELRRERAFCRRKGLPLPAEARLAAQNGTGAAAKGSSVQGPRPPAAPSEHCLTKEDEPAMLVFESVPGAEPEPSASGATAPPPPAKKLRDLTKKHVVVSQKATILVLKKYLALKLLGDQTRFREIDVLCNNEILGKDHTVRFVRLTRWRTREWPLQLAYRPGIF